MDARAVDDAAARLRDLRREEWENLALGMLALALSISATQVRPALAVPLFAGGMVEVALGIRAVWRRWDLVDRLAAERDAYVIPEVLAVAARETTLDRRHTFAAVIRCRLAESPLYGDTRVDLARPDLEALAADLDDPELELEPAIAVACMRLVSDVLESPLLDRRRPAEDLCARARWIRGGFTPRRPAT